MHEEAQQPVAPEPDGFKEFCKVLDEGLANYYVTTLPHWAPYRVIDDRTLVIIGTFNLPGGRVVYYCPVYTSLERAKAGAFDEGIKFYKIDSWESWYVWWFTVLRHHLNSNPSASASVQEDLHDLVLLMNPEDDSQKNPVVFCVVCRLRMVMTAIREERGEVFAQALAEAALDPAPPSFVSPQDCPYPLEEEGGKEEEGPNGL